MRAAAANSAGAPRATRARWAPEAAVLLLAALALYLYLDPWCNPDTVNSDAAIAVIQAADPGLGARDVFMWGQDRLGALNFLLARALLTWTGLSAWIAHAFFLQALYCLYLAGAFLVLARGASPAVKLALVLAAALPLTLEPGPYYRFVLMIDQVYPPQLFFLTAALALMTDAALQGPAPRRTIWLTLCLVLGTWMNPAEVLFAGAGLAVLGIYTLAGRRPALGRLAGAALALVTAAAAYQYLTLLSAAHWQDALASRALGLVARPDQLLDGAGRFLAVLWGELPLGRWPLTAALVLGLGSLFPWPGRLAAWRPVLADRLLIAALMAGALAYLALLGGLEHFRVNVFHARYTVPLWFAAAGCLLLIAKRPLMAAPRPVALGLAAALLALGLVQGWRMQARDNPEYLLTRELADQGAPLGVLGHYWNNHLYSFFYPEAILSAPLEGDSVRDPAHARRVLGRPVVLVNFGRWREEQHAPHDTRADAPPPVLDQYGLRLELAGLFMQQGHQKWWRYKLTGGAWLSPPEYAPGSALFRKPTQAVAAEIFGQTPCATAAAARREPRP